ncbi:MAG: MarR family winged helix-turn-helix transcriptional regulator [Candidatus Promineifilaceae bacterium]
MTQPSQSDRNDFKRFIKLLHPDARHEVMEVMGQLRSVSHYMNQRGEASLAASGLSYAQYRVLSHLLYNELIDGQSGMNPSVISKRHGTNRNTVSALVRSLEKSALVKRELDEQDRRKFNICLTDAGRELVYKHSREHFQAIDAMFSVLDEQDIVDFGRILHKLNQRVCQPKELN